MDANFAATVSTDHSATAKAIHLSGRFVFDAHRSFRDLTNKAISDHGSAIRIDLGNVSYMDSAALGMLLLANDKAKSAGKSIALVNCAPDIRQILEVANFHRHFAIS